MLFHRVQHLIHTEVWIVRTGIKWILLFNIFETWLPIGLEPLVTDVWRSTYDQKIHQRLIVVPCSRKIIADFVCIISFPCNL